MKVSEKISDFVLSLLNAANRMIDLKRSAEKNGVLLERIETERMMVDYHVRAIAGIMKNGNIVKVKAVVNGIYIEGGTI